MNKKTGSLILKILLVFFMVPLSYFNRLLALDPTLPVDQYLLAQWTKAHGLPTTTVFYLAQTPDGYLWVATAKGLVRFDGVTFSTIEYSKKPGILNKEKHLTGALLVDKTGDLWIGGTDHLTKYHYKTGQFTTLTRENGVIGDAVLCIYRDSKNNLWVSFLRGYLSQLGTGINSKFSYFNAGHGLEDSTAYSIIEDMKGNLLVGTHGKGLFQFQDGRFSRYQIKGLQDNIHKIYMIYEDRKGTLWMTTTKGLFRVKNHTDIYTTRDGLANDCTIDVIEDSDGNIWVGTLTGLNRLKQEPSGKIVIDTLFEGHLIYALFEDREKSLWIGTSAAGLKRLQNPGFTHHAVVDKNPADVIFSQFEDRRGNTWLGSLNGKLYRYGSKNGKDPETPGILQAAKTAISAVWEDKEGNLWLGTRGEGALLRKGDRFIQFTTRDGLVDDRIISIYTDSRNNTWFGTYYGVSRFHGGVFESLTTRDGLPGEKVYNIYEDKKHHIWLTTSKGLCFIKNGQLTGDNITVYLQGVPVTCMYEETISPDPGSGSEESVFWLGTGGAGLKRFKHGTFTSYTRDQGMSSDQIFHIFQDKRGNLWLSSRTGVFRVNKYELTEFGEVNCTFFGQFDGLKSTLFLNILSRSSALKNRQGELRFLTKKGIFTINPEKISINQLPPPVVIDTVVVKNQEVRPSLHRQENVFKGIKDIAFHFTAPTFISPKDIKFKYKLEGYDRDWVFLQPRRKRIARYGGLTPGAYTFRVTACNSDGVWNRTGVSMPFSITPFFYQTLLFKLLAFLVLISAGYLFYKWRPFGKNAKHKYKQERLNPIFAQECIKKLMYLMEIKKIYRDDTLSLQSLSEKLSITPHQLSQLLNEKLDKSFPDFINTYRIEEAKKLLRDRNNGNRKIIAIAFDVGFNTKSAFNNAFKKYNRMTASEYRKKGKR